ncbi:MAG: hypothetical protein Unbinned1502contig1001_47 [Prokaryotic dsDNA virus sp.]|nr:MAG: hypothetical protein Unbinned1502contig1001_47 [Prokaryotic dsDNA virus sp.]|tara:strand:+ start:7564 stop:7773 length:210 start_codon:yes stop_codon:yes gene_type:complete
MKVKIVFDVDAGARRDINNYFGREGRASHAEVASFIELQTKALFESIAQDDHIEYDSASGILYMGGGKE